jgi:HEAT repeat protein
MTGIVVIGSGAVEVAAQLDALGLATIGTREAFQSLITALADPELDIRLAEVIDAHMRSAGAPKFGGERPYLKKKKGRS